MSMRYKILAYNEVLQIIDEHINGMSGRRYHAIVLTLKSVREEVFELRSNAAAQLDNEYREETPE